MNLPPDAPLESAIVGLALTHPLIVIPLIEPDWFADERHTLIFNAVVGLSEVGDIVTPPSVESFLAARNHHFDGAHELIKHLFVEHAGSTPDTAQHDASEYAEKLRALHIRRSRIEATQRLDQALRAGDDDAAAVALKTFADDAGNARKDSLPDIIDAATLEGQNLERPAELVFGLFHVASKLVLGGSSKSFKTWTLLDLALSVAFGEPFLSQKTTRGRVLYINFEVQTVFFRDRMKAVAAAKHITIEPGHFEVWTLRGHAEDFRTMLLKIEERIRTGRYSLVILDPLYKLLGDADENKTGDMARLMNAIEVLCRETGAAVAFGSHYAKGNASGKESIDRISGSGVFARDPDSILTLTKHEVEDAFTVEATLRNFKPLPPFVVRWQFPLMRRAGELDPLKLKQVRGRKAEYAAKDLLPALVPESLTTSEWQKRCDQDGGISKRTFYRLYKELKASGSVVEADGKWRVVPEVPQTQMTP